MKDDVLTVDHIRRIVDIAREAPKLPDPITFVVPRFLVEAMRKEFPGCRIVDQSDIYLPPT